MWSSLAAVLGALALVAVAAEARTIGEGVMDLQSLVDTLGDEGAKRFNT